VDFLLQSDIAGTFDSYRRIFDYGLAGFLVLFYVFKIVRMGDEHRQELLKVRKSILLRIARIESAMVLLSSLLQMRPCMFEKRIEIESTFKHMLTPEEFDDLDLVKEKERKTNDEQY
jgi:hypothetical protein